MKNEGKIRRIKGVKSTEGLKVEKKERTKKEKMKRRKNWTEV